jgi:bacteriorhodopsin
MDTLVILVLCALEVIALFTLVRLWLRRRMRMVPRIFWSLLMLVPLFGLVMFIFIQSNLEPNPYKTETQADMDAFDGGHGGP